MKTTNTSKIVVLAGFFLAMGIILPYVTAHGFGMSGNILLPMHIPVLLCGFICGPLYGAFCGLLLPVINSLLTGMPVMFPMAFIMTGELTTYGWVSGLLNKIFGKKGKICLIYPLLLVSMAAGRIAYGIVAWLLLFTGATAGKFSVFSAVVTGLPGIAIQLLLIPIIVNRVTKSAFSLSPRQKAIEMVKNGKSTCVTVRDGKVETNCNSRGIAYIIDLYEKDMLKNAFVADKVVGKAAAMIFTLGGISECYAQNISNSALKWLGEHGISVDYCNRSEYIVNRNGDGVCPMELAVADIDDEQKAVEALKLKINS